MLNETALEHLEIRAGTTEHHADLCELARHLNTVNLPDNPAAIRALLEISERSFSGELKDPRMREYVFVLWDDAQRRVIGTSMIIGQLGRRGVPYIYLEVRSEEKYSGSLDRHFIHRVLTTRYSYDGPTEVGGLVMHPDARRSPERLGSLISYVRFLFIAMHRKDFRSEVLAELLPPFEPDGSSLLWEAYGRRFTGLSYREADQLSKSNKEFVSGLFPSEIYATLLAEEAQRVIGEVGPETRGVEKMLRRIGFRYAERVDPFDGGPHFICPTDEISLVRLAHERPIVAAMSGRPVGTGRALLARSYDGPPYFKAVPVRVAAANGGGGVHRSGSSEGVPASGRRVDSAARSFRQNGSARSGATIRGGSPRGSISAADGVDTPAAPNPRGPARGVAPPAGSEESASSGGGGRAGSPEKRGPDRSKNLGHRAREGSAGPHPELEPAAEGANRSEDPREWDAAATRPRPAHEVRGVESEPSIPPDLVGSDTKSTISNPGAGSPPALADGSEPEATLPSPGRAGAGNNSEASEDELPLAVPPSAAARLGILDRGSVFWMPLP